jgi:hypothetical protein
MSGANHCATSAESLPGLATQNISYELQRHLLTTLFAKVGSVFGHPPLSSPMVIRRLLDIACPAAM